VGKFVVMYSGSFGAVHDIESFIAAAELLRDEPRLRFILGGGGTRTAEVVQQVEQKALPNLTLLPFQDPEAYRQVLAASDMAIVTLDEGYEAVSLPSKTYYCLAAGLAIVAICGETADLADLVRKHGCGVHVLPHQPGALAEVLRGLCDDSAGRQRARQSARRLAEDRFSRRQQTQRYLTYLSRCFGWDTPRESLKGTEGA
jgi:glycosyltransferase involved in cell wall biosynthesis